MVAEVSIKNSFVPPDFLTTFMQNKKEREFDPYEITYDNLKDTLKEVMNENRSDPDKSFLIVPIKKACSKIDQSHLFRKQKLSHPNKVIEQEIKMNPEESEAKEIRNIIDNIIKSDKMVVNSSNNSSAIISGEEQRKSTHKVSRKGSKISTGSNQPLKVAIKPQANCTSRRTSIRTLNNTRSVGRGGVNRLLSSQTTSAIRKNTNVSVASNAVPLRSQQSIRKMTMPLKKQKTLAISLANNDEGNQPFELKDETENETTIDVFIFIFIFLLSLISFNSNLFIFIKYSYLI